MAVRNTDNEAEFSGRHGQEAAPAHHEVDRIADEERVYREPDSTSEHSHSKSQ